MSDCSCTLLPLAAGMQPCSSQLLHGGTLTPLHNWVVLPWSPLLLSTIAESLQFSKSHGLAWTIHLLHLLRCYCHALLTLFLPVALEIPLSAFTLLARVAITAFLIEFTFQLHWAQRVPQSLYPETFGSPSSLLKFVSQNANIIWDVLFR